MGGEVKSVCEEAVLRFCNVSGVMDDINNVRADFRITDSRRMRGWLDWIFWLVLVARSVYWQLVTAG